MPRLIDADKLMAWFDSYYDFDEFSVGYITGMIREQPTIDAVEVVRCRDCVHWEYDAIFPDGWCRGKHQGNPDWFCADGERRNDAETD